MLQFRTELQIPQSTELIALHHKVVCIGSCFADVVGNRLQENCIPSMVNPFGTVFNPVSIARLLVRAQSLTFPNKHTYVENQGVWNNLEAHSRLAATTLEQASANFNSALKQTNEALKQADWLIITLGSAWIYEYLPLNSLLVANCHKLPANLFRKRLLSSQEMEHALVSVIRNLSPRTKVLLSVSPVRHTKDGIQENSVSKSLLRVLCHKMAQRFSKQVHYFPSYELLIDDLRDYRFYKDDLVHPSNFAETYIWQKFTETFLDSDFTRFMKQWDSVQKMLNHRPSLPNRTATIQLLQKVKQQLTEIKKQFPQVDVRAAFADVDRRMTVA